MGTAASVRFPLMERLKGELNFSYFNVADDPDNGGESQLSLKYSAGHGKYINVYANRRWRGEDERGDTRDKVSLSSKWRIFEKFVFQTYGLWYRAKKQLEFGLKVERNDGNLDDPEYGYWGISITPHIDIRNANYRTELSFRKYDDDEKWQLQIRINALVGW